MSHAQALGALGQRRTMLKRAGRQELLVTDATLALLGPAGARLRKHALPAPLGRPFSLGDARVELFGSGHLPGSASLLIEVAGRRLVYAGTIRRRAGAFTAAAELRPADAICVDATFADPRFRFPDPASALDEVRRFVDESRAVGAAPVILAPAFGPALEIAHALAALGIALRGHRAVVAAGAAFRAAGVAVPVMARFAGKLGADEVLLWPPDARETPSLERVAPARFAFVSGFSQDPEAARKVRADVTIALSNQADHDDLVAYIEATGAREVAVHRGHAEAFAAHLRTRGLDAYPIGPPHQMDLFRG